MEAIFASLTPEEQLETRTKNPSLEDLAKEKAAKDKIDAAKLKAKKAGKGKGRVELEEEEAQEADELHAREEEKKREVEMELKKSEKAEEIEKEEKKVGVPVAKVSAAG